MKSIFTKGYVAGWTKEIFVISQEQWISKKLEKDTSGFPPQELRRSKRQARKPEMHNLTLISRASKAKFTVTLDNDMHLNGEYLIGLTDICLCTRFLVNMGSFEIEFNNNLNVNEIITKVISNQNVESDIKKC